MENFGSMRAPCSDCVQCQMCSRTRCRVCRKGDHGGARPQPGVGLTHGAYLKWKREMGRGSDQQ